MKEQKRLDAEAKKAVTKEQNKKKSALKKEGHANVTCCTYCLLVFHQISAPHVDDLSIHDIMRTHVHAIYIYI